MALVEAFGQRLDELVVRLGVAISARSSAGPCRIIRDPKRLAHPAWRSVDACDRARPAGGRGRGLRNVDSSTTGTDRRPGGAAPARAPPQPLRSVTLAGAGLSVHAPAPAHLREIAGRCSGVLFLVERCPRRWQSLPARPRRHRTCRDFAAAHPNGWPTAPLITAGRASR